MAIKGSVALLALVSALASCAPGPSLAAGTITRGDCVMDKAGDVVQPFTLAQVEPRRARVTLVVTAGEASDVVGEASGEFQAKKDTPTKHLLRVDGSSLDKNDSFECVLRIG